jgi:hypothetical protein
MNSVWQKSRDFPKIVVHEFHLCTLLFFTPASTRRSLSISPVRETISYFTVYSPSTKILLFFLSCFAQISLRNLQIIQFLLEKGRSYHSTLFSFFVAPVFPFEFMYCCNSYLRRFNSAGVPTLGHLRPSVLTLIQVVLTLFARFELCVSHSDLQNSFL